MANLPIREIGEPETMKKLFLESEDPEERRRALVNLRVSAMCGAPEAKFILASLMLDGLPETDEAHPEAYKAHAIRQLSEAADGGYAPALQKLNAVCAERYGALCPESREKAPGRLLRDCDGKEIFIDRTGPFIPVGARLTYENGRAVFTVYVNLNLIQTDDVEDEALLRQAITDGIHEWEGHYRVFGDQPLEVRVALTQERRPFDKVNVCPVSKDFRDTMEETLKKFPFTKKNEASLHGLVYNKQAMALNLGRDWSVHAPKTIFLQSDSGKFNEYDDLRLQAKHEFGHVLGLGDLYEDADFSLPGVVRGTYPELDCYHLYRKKYHLVMCNNIGPVSNNDIEMVLLAFRENRGQIYQPDRRRKRISAALGRGN